MFKLGQEKEAADFMITSAKLIKKDHVFKHWFPGSIAQGFLFKSGLLNNQPLFETMKRLLNISRIRESGRHLEVGATSLKTGEYHTFNETHPDILQGIFASTAIPGLFPFVKYKDDALVDGGLTFMAPVSSAIRKCKELGAKEITVDVILAIADAAIPRAIDKMSTTPFILLKTMFCYLNGILVGDIQIAKHSFPDVKV